MQNSLFLQLLLIQTIFAASIPSQQYVRTQNGIVKGHDATNRSTVFEYLGLPYAQSPVGNLRFAPPQELECQNQTIVHDAASWVTGHTAFCMIEVLISSSLMTAPRPPRSL